MVKSLKSTGKGAVDPAARRALPRQRRGDHPHGAHQARATSRAIIGLPANLFYGTGIPACIIVLDKEDAQARTGIFMIDASKGFVKDGNKNRLRPRDMHKIVDAFVNQKEIERYSRMVPVSEIADAKNDYNLNIPRYIDSSEPEDIQDLHAHLQGGIPNRDLDALQPYWDAFPSLRGDAVQAASRRATRELAVDKADIQSTITGSAEYEAFVARHSGTVDALVGHAQRDVLEGITEHDAPDDLIARRLGETLLDAFRPRPLIDEYGVYEQLMSYWNDSCTTTSR